MVDLGTISTIHELQYNMSLMFGEVCHDDSRCVIRSDVSGIVQVQ